MVITWAKRQIEKYGFLRKKNKTVSDENLITELNEIFAQYYERQNQKKKSWKEINDECF